MMKTATHVQEHVLKTHGVVQVEVNGAGTVQQDGMDQDTIEQIIMTVKIHAVTHTHTIADIQVIMIVKKHVHILVRKMLVQVDLVGIKVVQHVIKLQINIKKIVCQIQSFLFINRLTPKSKKDKIINIR